MRDTAGIDLSSIRLSLSGTDEGQESNYESDKIKDRAVTPMTLSFVLYPKRACRWGLYAQYRSL